MLAFSKMTELKLSHKDNDNESPYHYIELFQIEFSNIQNKLHECFRTSIISNDDDVIF